MAIDEPGAGWFPDPTGRHRVRYWTGTTWSGDVADNDGAIVEKLRAQESFPPPVPLSSAPRVGRSRPRWVRVLVAIGLFLVFVGGGIRSCDLALSGDEAKSWARPGGVILLVGVGFMLVPLGLAAWSSWTHRRAWPLWYGLAPLLLVVVGLVGMAVKTTVAPEIAVHDERDCGSVFSPRSQRSFEAQIECDDQISSQRARSVFWIELGLGATALTFTASILARRRTHRAIPGPSLGDQHPSA